MTYLGILLMMQGIGGNPLVALEGYAGGIPIKVVCAPIPGKDNEHRPMMLYWKAASAYADLVEAALRDGQEVRLTYAFRTNESQQRVKKNNRYAAAPPGFSPHQTGVAIDVGTTKVNGKLTGVYWWMKKNANRFGWKQTMKSEPWHWEFTEKATDAVFSNFSKP